mgnify:CR=1 FL=1
MSDYGTAINALSRATRRERDILDFIAFYIMDTGKSPGLTIIARGTPIKHRNQVQRSVNNLIRLGLLRRTKQGLELI